MPQSIATYVAAQMDDAPMTSFHWRVVALISAGFFLDLVDVAVFGSVVPDMVGSGFASRGNIAFMITALFLGTLIGSVGQGELTDRFGRKAIYQANLLIFGLATLASAFAPNYLAFAGLRFIAGIGLGAEVPLCFSYAAEFSPKAIRGRIMAFTHFVGGACSWPCAILFALAFRELIGWRGIFACIGVAALIVFVFRIALPESPRWLATHGQGGRALEILKRMGLPGPAEPLVDDAKSDIRSDPLAVVFRDYRRAIVAAMVAFFTIYCAVYIVATWLPSLMATDRGFTVTKALTFTFGMTLAYPLSSGFMMFALDKIGRLKVAICGLIAAAIMSLVFWQSTSETMLLVTGFLMFFCMQTGTNSMLIYTGEVFPTNARASGLGIALGASKLGALVSGYTVVFVQAFGTPAVFAFMAGLLLIGAVAVLMIGRETKGIALDAIAPPA
ncbi:MAG TPA: MFS transporter [Xanthobacteraceae bacterium]|jgi:putative MFS transporter|nr:MFS transporter [Xanthobacteraceae bacterium]